MEKSILEIIRKKYEESDFSSILYNVSGVYIPLDNSWKNIGIGMSGGVDSTLLVYILCTLIEKHNLDISVHVLSHVRMWKLRPWQKSINLNVFNYIKNRFPNINFKRYENGKGSYVTSFEILKEGEIDIILIENYPCKSKEELLKRERYWVERLKCVNKALPIRSKKEYREIGRAHV